MVFKISNNDKGSVVLDVEMWLERFDDDVNLWHSRIRVTTVADGLIDFIRRLISNAEFDAFDADELKSDIDEITDLPHWLYEKNDNLSVVMEDASKRHYEVFVPHVRGVLKEFCEKYGYYLDLSED